jgi:hypothetical protein
MFYKTVGDKVVVAEDVEVIYYVPEKYFDTKVAITIGERIDVMGVFMYGLYNKSGKQLSLKLFNCPTMITCKPSVVTKESKFHLEGTSEPSAYRLLHFSKGDELICSINIPQDVDNVEKFTNLLMRSNLPETIPYDKLHEIMLKNAELNGFNYKISPQIIGIVVSELCRDPKDLSHPFRFSSMEDMCGYKAISILQIPKYTSAYTAITSENADEAIAAAMTVKSNTVSPLEKMMMESVEDIKHDDPEEYE